MGKGIYKGRLTPYNDFEVGINKKYGISAGQLPNLRNWLSRKSLSSTFLYNNQAEYLVSLRAYPFWMQKFYNYVGNWKKFPIGPFSAKEVGVNGCELQQQKEPVLLGTTTINRKFNNFMDYAPFTKVSAYIPYLSFVDLPTNEVMGKTIYFYAQMDFDNGLMNVWVECNGTMIQSWQTKIGIDIALNYTNGTDIMRNMYLFTIGLVTGTGSQMVGGDVEKGTPWGTSMTFASKEYASFVANIQHHVNRGAIGSGVNLLYAPQSIYIIYQRCNPNEPDVYEDLSNGTFASLHGLPLNKSMCLSTLTGFTKVSEIHLEGFKNTLQPEKDSIINLLRSGVIL